MKKITVSLIALAMLLIPFSNVAAASKSKVEIESNTDENSYSLE